MKSKSAANKASRPRARATPPPRRAAPKRDPLPIVGIGASAGGLEAIEQFVKAVPPDSGLALVVVQHMDPTQKGMLAELLQRVTAMQVIQVKDRTRVQPNRVYVIPPNTDMSILRGVLHLLEPTEPRGLRLPIDFFFRSLALDQQERSIGVLLSGMGTDGTLGLRSIKEKAGIVLIQDPATALFDGMPSSAIAAGLADFVAPAEELPGRIMAYLRRTPLVAGDGSPPEDQPNSALQKIIILLRARTGQDFSLYKSNTLFRRIERRMGIHQIGRIAAYVRYLQENSQELDLLLKELLIGVTSFFRDPEAWEQLRDQVIPTLLAQRPPGHVVRAWVAGCSTGEEAHSLAIVLTEAIEQHQPREIRSLQIFATDLDRDAIEKARDGLFPSNIAADVSEERLRRFFTREEGGYRVIRTIREMVIFAPQNLIMDPPFTKLDLLICRNLLIYLNSEVQKKLIRLFHYTLGPGGILFLGSSESIGDAADLFAPVDRKSRLFVRSEAGQRSDPVEFPTTFSGRSSGPKARPAPNPPLSLQALADHLLLQRYAPSAVFVNTKGDICYVSGRTGRYLEPAAGKANWNIFAMAREGLRAELTRAFHRALGQEREVVLHGLKVETDGGSQRLDIVVQRVDEPGSLEGLVLIVFKEVGVPAAATTAGRLRKHGAGNPQIEALEQELRQLRAETRVSQDDMQTAQEELRSSNEELQSANEELQSTNEELTTSKEEMQSLNEELQMVNAELQAKIDELSQASNDMVNLLNSTDIATLFLDNNLNVRRFTPQATKVIKLIPGDIGRPITDLASDLRYPELAADAQEVLQTLASIEKPISAHDGRWFSVRIMPYRTQENSIQGLVITFANITASKTLEARLRATQAGLEQQITDQSTRLEPAE